MNTLFYMTNPTIGADGFIAIPAENAELFRKVCDECNSDLRLTEYHVGEVPFEALPMNIQKEVLDILKVYDKCGVDFYQGGFHTTIGCCIQASYPHDFFVAGSYKAVDLYTVEERRKNYRESFGDDPIW